jgi:DNA-binding XRE family transcriptional regulator
MAKQPKRRPRVVPKGSRKGTAGKDPELVALGCRLASLREKASLTQEALADAAELHWTYIGQIERGERNLSYKNVLKLARGLGVKPAELMPND